MCDRVTDAFSWVGADLRTGGQKPGFCPEDALQPAETRKNPVSWLLMPNINSGCIGINITRNQDTAVPSP